MKRWFRVSTIFFLVISLILSACVGQGPREENVIRVGYLPITHAAPLYFSKEFEEEFLNGGRIELVRFGSWIELMDALNTGRIDGASVLFELAMKAREKGIDLKAVALGHRDGNAIVVGHDIDDVSDLKGETVAIPHTLSAHNILLDDMLQQAGLNYEDVNVVEMPPPEMPSALSEGRISSYIVAEPFGALGVTLDTGHVLFQSNEIRANSLCCVLVLRSDFMEEQPEFADTFVKGYIEAGKKAESFHVHEHGDGSSVHNSHHGSYVQETVAQEGASPDEGTDGADVSEGSNVESSNLANSSSTQWDIKETHMNYLNITEEALALSLNWISYADLQIKEEEYEFLRQRVVEMGLSDNPPLYEDFVDQSFFEEEM
ncbi:MULTISPECIES: ABC transporter substrate-binding protein [Bacillaceae]|uniref:ABC transporter substrate-binding protein n=1 Tax=Bacillaceae TaxID=186817 RepID=UPI000B441ED2|nr:MULTISPECIES: ABC transporter substrate-binding protein [Bacillaceae]